MININIEAHKRTLAALQELENTMINERENQKQNVDEMRPGWHGETTEAFLTGMPDMLQYGLYEKILNQVKKVRTIMEDALPEIVSLKSRCDTFDNCLKGTVPDNTLAATGNLMLDADKAEEIISALENIISYNEIVYEELNKIMSACNGLVDFGNCQENLYAAYSKIKKGIGVLKSALVAYRIQVLNLDKELRLKYAETYDLTDYNVIVQHTLMCHDDSTIESIRGILEKDASEWSSKDAEIMAETLDRAFRQESEEIINLYIEYLVKENTYQNGTFKTGYIVQTDTDAVTCILNAMKKAGMTGEAFYTLNRLNNYQYAQEKKGEGLFFMHNVSVVNGDICIKLDIRNNNEIVNTMSFTSVDMKKEIQLTEDMEKLGFTEADIETFRRRVYSEGDIEFLKLLTGQNYADAFEYKISNCSSLTGENIVSYIMQLEYTNNCAEQEKIINTLLCNTELNNEFHKGCLFENSTHGEYIDLILLTLDQDMTATKAFVTNKYKEMSQDALLEQYDYESRLFRQSSLWAAVDKIYTCDFRDYDKATGSSLAERLASMAHGYCYAQIEGLASIGTSNESKYQFDFSLYRHEEDDAGNITTVDDFDGGRLRCVVEMNEGEDVELVKKQKRISDIRYELKMLPVKTAYNAALGVVDGYLPGTSNVVNTVAALSEDSKQECIDNILSFPLDSYKEELSGYCVAASVGQSVIDGIFEYYELQDAMERVEKDENELAMGKTSDIVMSYREKDGTKVNSATLLLQSETMTAVSAVRSKQLMEEDGVKYYLEDICKYMEGDEINRAYDKVMEDDNVKRAYNDYRNNQTTENYIEYISCVNKSVKSYRNEIDTDGRDMYNWLQGADIKWVNE